MTSLSNHNFIDLKLIIISTIVGIVNSFFCLSYPVMMVLLIVELIVLSFCFYNQNFIGYLKYYLIFLCFSMESSNFVGADVFYGFKNFRLFGLNVAVWALLPLFFKSICNLRLFDFYGSKLLKSMIKRLVVFSILGVYFGLLNYLFDDNGFASKEGSFSVFINVIYSYFLPLVQILTVSWVIFNDQERIDEIKKTLFSIIVALSVVFVLCLVLGNYGNRAGLLSLQVSDVYFILVVSLGMVVYSHFGVSSKILLAISGFVILICALTFNTNGKIIIASFVLPIVMLFVLKKNGVSLMMAIVSCCVVPLCFVFVLNYFSNQTGNVLLNEKHKQVAGLVDFTSESWFDDIPSSPKMRLTEFLNITQELIDSKMILFGKGFSGTIKDNRNYFDVLSESSFSSWELELGAYYSMHESLNCFYLVGGLFGLCIFFSILWNLIRFFHKSPWLIIGFFWFLLFYNYHLTIAIYGISALIVGIQEASENTNELKLCK